MEKNGVFYRRKIIFDLITSGSLEKIVLDELLPKGQPHEYEKQLWDYKESLPTLPKVGKPNKTLLNKFNYKLSEIIKDAVSFYNSYGGYLLIGVSDSPRSVVGFKSDFDCDELNKRIRSLIGQDIDCHYKTHCISISKKNFDIGILFIPKRKDGVPPAQFKKNSEQNESGKFAFRKDDIYFRDGSECRPAKNSDDFSFLCSQGCRQISYSDSGYQCEIIDNNLGAKDPGFIKFIGREEYLTELWKWLFDKYMPIKLLTGLGGVGKTTLAREFIEDLISTAPIKYERVVWLSAKQQFYTAIMGDYKPTSRIDFTDLQTLLISILKEVGWPDKQIDGEWSREELMDKLIESLIQIPIFLVIDDIDSLDLPEQHDVFQTILLLFGQTIGKSKVASRALLTARLDLGAAPNQYITVKGLNHNEFVEFISIASESINLKLSLDKKSKIMKKFHRVTDGSPTFAASILRLLATGDDLNTVLTDWKGSTGEEVRNFAFKKELKNLTGSQLRTLYAGCILGETSLLELRQITISNDTLLKDDIGSLKQYHLISLDGGLPSGGSRLVFPNSIRLMKDLIKEKIPDPIKIEKECAKLRAGTPKVEDNVGMVIHRVLALWKESNYNEALEVARWGNKKYKQNADMKCLLGRSYMNVEPPDYKRADTMFRRAFELKCERTELYELWINAKNGLDDWIGIIDVTNYAKDSRRKDTYLFLRVEAYGKVAEAAKAANNKTLASEFYLKGGQEIDISIKNKKYISRKNDLLELRDIYYQSHINIVDQMISNPRDYLETWLAVWELFNSNYFSISVINLGIARLGDWWNDVMERKNYTKQTRNLFEIQIKRISRMVKELTKIYPNQNDEIEAINNQYGIFMEALVNYDKELSKTPS